MVAPEFYIEGQRQLSAPVLTAREGEVLALIARGCSNRYIADQLSIQLVTVKRHVGSIIAKLGVNGHPDYDARVYIARRYWQYTED